jgi:hypothetical protein
LTGTGGWHCRAIDPEDLPDNTNAEQMRKTALEMLRVARLVKRIIKYLPEP